jgi:hypothetical protein
MKNSVGFACTAHKGARYLQSGETVSTVLPHEQVTSMPHHFCSILRRTSIGISVQSDA